MNCILLVEDNALNRMVVEDLFEYDDIDATLVSAETGEEAVEIVSKQKPCLILMDLELPGMSGLQTMNRMREEPELRSVPVWALSAHAMKAQEVESLAAGFDDYVTKPIDTKQFAERLRRFISAIPEGEASSCSNP
jgi:CheY-like chemotaxis protein